MLWKRSVYCLILGLIFSDCPIYSTEIKPGPGKTQGIIFSLKPMDDTSVISYTQVSPGVFRFSEGQNFTAILNIIKKRLKTKGALDNDANCFILGESLYGSGKGCNNLIGLTFGTGVGGGIIINKKVYHGKGNAGELGHITIKRISACQFYFFIVVAVITNAFIIKRNKRHSFR